MEIAHINMTSSFVPVQSLYRRTHSDVCKFKRFLPLSLSRCLFDFEVCEFQKFLNYSQIINGWEVLVESTFVSLKRFAFCFIKRWKSARHTVIIDRWLHRFFRISTWFIFQIYVIKNKMHNLCNIFVVLKWKMRLNVSSKKGMRKLCFCSHWL